MRRHHNPFGLTEKQAEAMDLYIEVGRMKLVADRLDIGLKAAQQRVSEGAKKLSKHMPGAMCRWAVWRATRESK